MGNFEVLIVEAVEQEVEKIRNNCFGAFTFQKLCQMIVGSRKEFNKDFSNDSNTRFLNVECLYIIKSLMISLQSFLNLLRDGYPSDTNFLTTSAHLR